MLALLASCSNNQEEPAELEFISIRIERELGNLYDILEDYVDSYDLNQDSLFLVDYLNEIYKTSKYARVASYVSNEGVLLFSAPAMSKVSGIDISHQEHVKFIIDNLEPVLGTQFRSVQGFNSVTLSEPVLQKDTLHSFFSILISPQLLISDIIDDYPYLNSCDVWVVEKNGTLIYDKHIEEIGKNVLEDESYSSLEGFKGLVDTIFSSPNGVVSYSPQNDISQNVAWRTVEFLDTEWIVVLEFNDEKPIVFRTPEILGIKSSQEGLIDLSENDLFLEFLANGDTQCAEDMMKNFYDDCPGIFSIQWIDSNAQHRIGFPLHNLNYLGHNLRAKCTNANLLYALHHRSLYNFDDYISEDYYASFITVPLYRNKKYLGLLYYNQLQMR